MIQKVRAGNQLGRRFLVEELHTSQEYNKYLNNATTYCSSLKNKNKHKKSYSATKRI